MRPTFTLFMIAAAALIFASCAENEPLTMPELSSVVRSSSSALDDDLLDEEGDSSGALSSGAVSSSSTGETEDDGDKIEESKTVPQIEKFALSRWVNPGELLLRWDAPLWNPGDVDGLVIERDRNYTGWAPLDTLKGDEIRQGLWLDNSLENTTQFKYRYRAYTLKIDTTGESRRSPFTAIVGTMALDDWGFIDTEFDTPTGFTGCWQTRRAQELNWNVRRMAQAGGWVIQALAGQDTVLYVDSTRAKNIDGFHPTDSVYVVRGTWIDLDTLSEDNNHYLLNWPPFSSYRIYAYYLDEFKGVTSEYSPEVSLADITPPNACFTDRIPYMSAVIAVDTTKKAVEWNAPTAFYDCQQVMMNGDYYPPSCSGSSWSCRSIRDEFGVASPCWNLGMESLPWDSLMSDNASAYNVRGVALNREGDALWAASPWRRK